MGKIKRLLDRFDEMGRYPIQELGYSRTWLMFSYLGAFLVHRCTIADYFLYHFYERNRRGRAEFVTLYDMRDIHRKNPQTAFADFEEKDRFLDRFQGLCAPGLDRPGVPEQPGGIRRLCGPPSPLHHQAPH